ncbi:MAG: hypothetical protein HC836_48560 [Richelia sp. RM2_1_2]|nr:hypothetical protein [Richelia sp. RM2_1_2]
MTPEQKLQFFSIIRNANSNNYYLTVDEIVNILGIEHGDIRKSWHSEFKVFLALEHNYKWTVYAKEIDKDTNI